MSMFKRAQKSQRRLRMALVGPSNGGKTYTALTIATGLGGRIAVIDTERGSSSLYAVPPEREEQPLEGEFRFDMIELDTFAPQSYIQLIEGAETEGYDVLIIDSLSHAWFGRGGELEMVDKVAKRSRSGNSYMAWREVTPHHNALIDAIIRSRCHVIATMRSKTEYVLQPNVNTGKSEPKKVGMAPIQREGMDYEFDVVADMDVDNNLIVSKTRCRLLAGMVINKPGPKLGATLAAWLSDGAPIEDQRSTVEDRRPTTEDRPILALAAHEVGGNGGINQTSEEIRTVLSTFGKTVNDLIEPGDQPSIIAPSTPDQHGRIMALVSTLGMSFGDFDRMLKKRGVQTVPDLSATDATEIIIKLQNAYDQANLVEPMMESINAATSGPDDGPPFETRQPTEGPTPTDGPAKEEPDATITTDDHVIADVTRKEKPPKSKGRGKKEEPAGEPLIATP